MAERVTRDGGTVRRPLQPWSASVQELLKYLEAVDFPAPRVISVEDDEEILSWIEGESGSDGWAKVTSDDGVRSWGRFLRDYHDAVADYQPSEQSIWSSGAATCENGQIVCHGDFGPWNAVWREGAPVALIDWDHARPAVPLFDLSYGIEYVAPFRSDGECLSHLGHVEAPNRRDRIKMFCEGYGVPVPDDIVGCVAEQQKQTAKLVERLAAAGIEPQATWVRQGYLRELAERVRFTESVEL